MPSVKESRAGVNKAAQQAMFKLHAEEQVTPNVINVEEDNSC